MSIKKNVYFICSGVSTNDVINSANNIISKKNKKSIFNFFTSSSHDDKNNNSKIKIIKKNELSRLDKIGIKELYLCQENEENSKILDSNNKVYTSLDYQSIESSFILFRKKSINDLSIYPLPNMSTETNIKSATIFDKFKKKFGKYEYNKGTKDETIVNKYWDTKWDILNFKNSFYNIKKFNTIINWKYTTNKWNLIKKDISSLHTYDFKKFKLLMEYICINDTNTDIIFICKNNVISDILKMFKTIKFDIKKDNLEYTSIWKINILVNNIKKIVQYIDYEKIYPTEYNYKPLKYNTFDNNEIFQYNLNGKKYILFNSLKFIPIEYLKIIQFQYQYYTKNQQNSMIKILNKKKNNNNKDTTNSSDTYESLTDFFSEK